MRLIDADRLLTDRMKSKYYHLPNGDTAIPIIDIEHAPTIDAVEVVRCRECEYWKCNPNTKNYGVCRKVSYDDFEVVMEKDDFCSYGERREDGEA